MHLGWREEVIAPVSLWTPLGEFRDCLSLPYGACLQPSDGEYGPDMVESIADCLGFLPAARIHVDAYVHGRDSHRGLGHFVLGLAEATGGLIDLYGAIAPPDPSAVLPPAHDVEAVRAYIREMPGRIIEVPYELAAGGDWIFHIVDAEFLRMWLNHPDFHMIK